MTTRTASSSGDTQLDRTLLQAMRYGQLAAHFDITKADHKPAHEAMGKFVRQFTKDIQAALWGAFWKAYHQLWCADEVRALLG